MNANGEWQLAKLTLQYCKWGGSSRGTRKFLREGLTEFANKNPQVLITALNKANRHPVAVGVYANKNKKVVDLRKKEPQDVMAVLQDLRNTSGRKMTKIKSTKESEQPSIQGEWRDGAAQKAEVTIEKTI